MEAADVIPSPLGGVPAMLLLTIIAGAWAIHSIVKNAKEFKEKGLHIETFIRLSITGFLSIFAVQEHMKLEHVDERQAVLERILATNFEIAVSNGEYLNTAKEDLVKIVVFTPQHVDANNQPILREQLILNFQEAVSMKMELLREKNPKHGKLPFIQTTMSSQDTTPPNPA